MSTTRTPLSMALDTINAGKGGNGFIKSVHQNGRKGIAFRLLWGNKIDFITFEIVTLGDGEYVSSLGYMKRI